MEKILKKTNKFFDIVSLSDFKSRFFIFLFILLFLLFIPISVLENNFPELSICKKLLKENCPSSGITRGVSSLLKGNLNDAINYNILSIPVLITIICIMIIDLYKIRRVSFSKTFRNK